MTEDNIRHSLGKWAGNCYLPANVGLTFKGVIDSAIENKTFDMHSLISEPITVAMGGCFLLASALLAKHGDKNDWVTAAMGTAATGFALSTYYTIDNNYNSFSVLTGPVLGFSATAYSCYQTYKLGHKNTNIPEPIPVAIEAKKEPSLISKKLGMIQKNINQITEKYPLATVGVCDFVSSASLALGAYNAGDDVMTGLGALWCAGAGLLTFALPKVKNNTLMPGS